MIQITRTTQPKEKPDQHALGFGKYYTDHMLIIDYTAGQGWHDARIVPFGPLPLHPAAVVLHYGMEIFEGLKAYRRPDGRVQLFRPIENVRRMNNSARRLSLPTMDESLGLEALTTFVELEQGWVPSLPGTSLYLRPFLYASEPNLALHAIQEATYVLIASPVASYFSGGLTPVSIMIEDEDVRAVRGGTGEAKCGGNYAAATRAGDRAEAKGYSQVLWLDGVERKYIEEVGAMNVMFKIAGEVVTPKLTGSILPGITRKSAIELLKSQGVQVSERLISAQELLEAAANGALEEAWGIGTAAIISPIGSLSYQGQDYAIHGGKIGPVAQKLYDDLSGIQWGLKEDTMGWTVPIPAQA
ncbi:MAG: branched-chain amino acid aminotransferase [Oscillospiraceae bacterium]|nr:branched-chain amino acid aminotransferase [Oscillospiraceae bacterium]